MAPHRLTVRLDDENAEWVEQRAEESGRSKAYVVNEAISEARGDTRTTPHRDGAHRTDDTHTADADRLDELESRISEIESQLSDPTAESASDSPLSGSGSDRIDTTREGAPEDGLGAVDADDVRGRVREIFEGRSRMKEKTVDAVVAAAVFLAERGGAVETSELKAHIYDEVGDRYDGNERDVWEAVRRYFDDVPMIQSPGYAKYEYTG